MLIEAFCIGLLIAACASLLPAKDDSFPGVVNLNPNSLLVLSYEGSLDEARYEAIQRMVRSALDPLENRLGFRTPCMVLHQKIKLAGRVTLDHHEDILEWMRKRDQELGHE